LRVAVDRQTCGDSRPGRSGGAKLRYCSPTKVRIQDFPPNIVELRPTGQPRAAIPTQSFELLNCWDGPSRPSTTSAKFSFYLPPGRPAGHSSSQPSLSLWIHGECGRPASSRRDERFLYRWTLYRAGAIRSADGSDCDRPPGTASGSRSVAICAPEERPSNSLEDWD